MTHDPVAGEGCFFADRAAPLPGRMRLEHSSVIPLKRMPALAARGTFGHWLDGQRRLVRMLERRILPIVRANPAGLAKGEW
jgi:hypothetical protein